MCYHGMANLLQVCSMADGNMLPSVYRSTSDSVLPVGKLSLNLVSPSIAKCSNAIQGILQHLLPKVSSHLNMYCD